MEIFKKKIGVVVIGRNEGMRLKRCFRSLINKVDNIVYVDSGSTDESIMYARACGIDVLNLDESVPFSAGRARNEGFYHLSTKESVKYIQFIDGDCELCDEWIEKAIYCLDSQPDWAIVVGHVQERSPEKSIYNRLCDMEWKAPIGQAAACGGIFMVRCEAFRDVCGFNSSLIAGEEPELCYRLRENGWTIFRIDHPMTIHDAAMTHFVQWWIRTVRSGYAYLQGYVLHGSGKEKYYFKDTIRIWIWAFFLPVVVVLLSTISSPLFSIFLSLYLVQLLKIVVKTHKDTDGWKSSFLYAFFNVLGKWPQWYGQCMFLFSIVALSKKNIIEYKK